jgi:hypothetical protein
MENPGYCKTCEDHTTGPGRNVETKRLFDINTDCHWLSGANRDVSQACYQYVIGNTPFKKNLSGIFVTQVSWANVPKSSGKCNNTSIRNSLAIFVGYALLHILKIIGMKFVVGGHDLIHFCILWVAL